MKFYKIASASLTAQDMYDFHGVSVLFNHYGNQLENYEKSELQTFLKNLKQKYLTTYRQLVVGQLSKYLSRGRTDKIYTAEHLNSANFSNLDLYMKSTYRSDMKRRNTRWEELTESLANLEKSNTTKTMLFHMDRVNNACHNIQTSADEYEKTMLKLPNGHELIQALDFCFSTSITELFRKLSYDVKHISVWKNIMMEARMHQY